MKNWLKTLSALTLTFLLAACGGHGYEGNYKLETDGAMGAMLKMAQKMGGQSGDVILEIGDDYIISNGEKTELDDIVVRESGGKKYLVFVSEDGEESFEIDEDDNLIQNTGFGSLKFKKI